jgi:murein DD-endopeptidase MepM/ murein hydrolase activator NlpD
MDNPVPLIMEETIPSIFPLPETYKQKITWGYHKKARHPITQELTLHQGIDVAAPTGTPVSATGEGVVRKAAHEKGWGKLVVIEHGGGFTTFYAHLDEMSVEKGMKVAVGPGHRKGGQHRPINRSPPAL